MDISLSHAPLRESTICQIQTVKLCLRVCAFEDWFQGKPKITPTLFLGFVGSLF